MTQQATGAPWSEVDGFDAGSARKALYGSFYMRDGDGVNTALDFVEENGIWVSGFNPFAADGQFPTDLKVEQGGTWYSLGGGSTEGPSFANKIETKKDRFWQSRQTIRTDVVSEEGTVKFGMGEYSTLSDTLEMDLPLRGTPAKGAPNYARKRPNEFDGRIRQAIVYQVDKGGFFTADVFPNLSIENIEDRKLSPEELIKTILTWGISIDPHSGYSHARFRAGPGWQANPGPPVWSEAPMAQATAGGAVTIGFVAPKGPAEPFTYKVTKTLIETGVVSDLAIGTPVVNSGYTTVPGTGLTATKDYTFQVHVTNAAGKKSISAKTNEVTALS